MKKYSHLFFDLDRTLWDFETNSKETFRDIYKKYDLQSIFKDFEVFFQSYRKNNEHLWSLYREGKIKKDELRYRRFLVTLNEFGNNDIELSQKIGEDYVSQGPLKTHLFPHTIEILDYLKEEYNLYIITNGFKEVQFTKLKRSGLESYFKKVITSEDVGCQKPHPEVFQYALSTVNAKKNASIMIGDDFKVDIQGAMKFGMDQIYFNPNNLPSNGKATYEINSLIQLKEIF